jgi:heme-degrading monooxygenase HmoA
MVIVLIRNALRPGVDVAAYEALNARMFEILQGIPGFISVNGYSSADGDELGMVRFESLEALRAWREHPEHVLTRARGRNEFYASLQIEVCEVVRSYDLAAAQAAAATGAATPPG